MWFVGHALAVVLYQGQLDYQLYSSGSVSTLFHLERGPDSEIYAGTLGLTRRSERLLPESVSGGLCKCYESLEISLG